MLHIELTLRTFSCESSFCLGRFIHYIIQNILLIVTFLKDGKLSKKYQIRQITYLFSNEPKNNDHKVKYLEYQW